MEVNNLLLLSLDTLLFLFGSRALKLASFNPANMPYVSKEDLLVKAKEVEKTYRMEVDKIIDMATGYGPNS